MAELFWSRRAISTLAAQDDWLRARNPVAANALLDEVARSADLITEFPEMGSQIEGTGLRCLVTRRYRFRIIYRLAPEGLQIVDVMHPRRDRT